MFASFGQTFFISLFSDDIRQTFNLTDGQFGSLYMAATLASAVTLTQLGRVVDHFSIAAVTTVTLLLLAVACVAMALATHVAMLFVVLYGLRLFGQGMLTHTAQTAMGRWYDLQRGRAVSVVSLGHNAGEAILPGAVLMLGYRFSWQWIWILAAILLAFLATPICRTLMSEGHRPIISGDPASQRNRRQWTRWEVLRDPNFYLASLGVLAPAFIASAIYFHHKHLLIAKNWPEEIYATAFLLLAASTVVSKMVAGILIDRMGAARLLPSFLLPLSMACFGLGSATDAWTIYPSLVCLGIAMGVSNSLFGALWPEVYGTRHLGSIRSVAVAGIVCASALGPGLSGLLIDRQVRFADQLMAMGVYSMLTLGVMMIVSRGYQSRG